MPARKYIPRVCNKCGNDYLPTSGNQRFCKECGIEVMAEKTRFRVEGKHGKLSEIGQVKLASFIALERIKSGLNYVEDINDISWAR